MQPIGRTIIPDVISEQRLVTLSTRDTVRTAVELMAERRIGAVPIVEKGRLVGIFTERDVLRCAGEGSMFGEVAVENVMTPRPFTASPGDDLLEAAEFMAAKRIRHLPVCEGDFLIGMIGIRDVLRGLVEQAAQHDGARDTARALLTRAPRL